LTNKLFKISPEPRSTQPRALLLVGVLVISCLSGGAGRPVPVNPAVGFSETNAPSVRSGVGVTTRPFLARATRRLDPTSARQQRVKFPSSHAAGAAGSLVGSTPSYTAEPAWDENTPPVYSRLSAARPSDRGPPSV
jgi:hypothetical protein